MEIVRVGKLDEGQKAAFDYAVNSLIVDTRAIMDLIPEEKKESVKTWLSLFARSVVDLYQNQDGGELSAEQSAITKVNLALNGRLDPIPTEKL